MGDGAVRQKTSSQCAIADEEIFKRGNPVVLRGIRQAVLRARQRRGFQAAGNRFLVRHQVSRPPDLEWRNLQHVRDDRGAQNPADTGLRARSARSRQRSQRGGARQRSRTLRRRSDYRPVLCRGEEARRRWSRVRRTSRSGSARLPDARRGGSSAANGRRCPEPEFGWSARTHPAYCQITGARPRFIATYRFTSRWVHFPSRDECHQPGA